MHSNWAITLEELDYVGPKNYKFQKVPKVLAQAKPQGVVGGSKKKLSKRMAMRSNCNGSSREFESQKNNELSAASGERIKILILMFLPPRRVVEPIV